MYGHLMFPGGRGDQAFQNMLLIKKTSLQKIPEEISKPKDVSDNTGIQKTCKAQAT